MIEYLIKSTVCLTVLYFGFIILLKKSRNYKTNRVFLLFSVLFSLVTPLLNLSYENLNSQEIIPYTYIYKTFSTTNQISGNSEIINSESINNQLNFSNFLTAVYIIITFFLLGKYIRNLYILILQNITSDKTDYRGNKIVLLDKKVNPFCFFRAIYVSKYNFQSGTFDDDLILHETAHKEQLHTIDVIITELLQVFFWFNPFIYLFKRLIKVNHEFLADDFVMKSGVNNKDYSNKLINTTFRNKTLNLASGFNYLLIKNRLIMLSKYEQKKRIAYQLAFFVPIIALLFVTTAFTNTSDVIQTATKSKIVDTKLIQKPGTFYADTLFWSGENHEIYMRGKVIVKHGENDFKGSGSFSFLGEVHLLIFNGKPASLNSSIILSGTKCEVIELSKEMATKKYGSKGKLGAVEINTIE